MLLALLFLTLGLQSVAQIDRRDVLHNPLWAVAMENMTVLFDETVVLSTSKSVLKSSGESVGVHWSGYKAPDDGDWIGVFVEGYDIAKTSPVKYFFLRDADSHLETGAGSIDLIMLNHRGPLVVYAFTGGLESPVAVARSATIAFQSYDVPTGIHLIAAPDGDVLVQWTTRLSDRPVVQFAPAHALASSPTPFDSDRPLDEPGDWKEVQATDSTYAREDMCGPPASTTGYISPGVLHTARMSGLRPGVAYAYRVGDPDNDGPYSDIAFFIAAPKPDRFARVRVLAMADQGTDEVDGSSQVQGWDHYFHGSVAVSEAVNELVSVEAKELPNLVVMNGDLAYGMGFVATWDSWMHLMRRSMASVPWLVSIGNHERGWPGSGGLFPGTDSGGECGVPYAMRFPLVSPKETEGRRGGAGIGETGRERAERLAEGREGASPMTGAIGVADAVQGRLDAQGVERAAGDEPWWSYEIGPIHMVQMSTEHDFSRGSPQHTFIEKDLEAVDRCRTPWVVVGGHRPFYIDSDNASPVDGDQAVSWLLRWSLESLLHKHRVDMTWSGHHHSYQRTCPIRKGRCVKDGHGVVHVVMGHAGAGLCTNVLPDTPKLFEKVYLGFGYVTVEAWTDAEAGEHVLDLTSWGVGDGTEPAHIVDTVSLMREVDSDCDKNHAGENGEVQREQ